MSDPAPPPRYVPYGRWAEHAPTIERMVEKGWGVSDAVRQVVANQGFKDPDHAFRGIRAAHYERRKRKAQPRATPLPKPKTPERPEEFEI